MPAFVFAYRGPLGYEPSPEAVNEWRTWFDTMAGHLVDLGKPVVDRAALGDCDSARTQLGGYSLIQAEDLEAAVAIAKGCPHLQRNGGVEIGLLGEVPDPNQL